MGRVVIEDDYDGEFRYDRQPVGALQALAPGQVVYAGTASKSLAPGLRLGWLVVPPRLLDAVTAELAAGPSGIDQLTLAEFITSGDYDRQIRRARLAYRRRRDRLAMILNGQELRGRGLRISGIAAGLHAVLDCSGPSRERDIIARATEGGLALDGLERFRAGAGAGAGAGVEVRGIDAERAGLVIGYSRPPEHAYTTALARLRAVLAQLSLINDRRLRTASGSPPYFLAGAVSVLPWGAAGAGHDWYTRQARLMAVRRGLGGQRHRRPARARRAKRLPPQTRPWVSHHQQPEILTDLLSATVRRAGRSSGPY